MSIKDKSLSRIIHFLAWDIQNLAQRMLKPYDVTLEQFHLLKVISKKNTNLTQTEICQKTSKSAGNITRIIDRLESKSLVIRRPSPNDRRAIVVALTKEGQSVLEKAEAVFIDFSSKLSSGMDKNTQKALKQAMGVMTVNVTQMLKEAKKRKQFLYGDQDSNK